MNNSDWYVYIVKCKDDSLYTGISKNVEVRISKHNLGKGAKSIVKSKRPVELVYVEKYKDRSEASKRESEIKKLSRDSKQKLVRMGP
jgi:putative endonuclease